MVDELPVQTNNPPPKNNLMSSSSTSAVLTAKVISGPINFDMNLADAEFNKMLQKQSTKLLAAFGYKLIAKFSSHYDLPFEEMCEIAGLKKRKAPKKEKTGVDAEKKVKPELTEEEKAAKKAALIARLAEGRAKKAAEKAALAAAEGSDAPIQPLKEKKVKVELTEEEKAAKKAAAAEKRKASLAAKKAAAEASSGEGNDAPIQPLNEKNVKIELTEEEKAAKKKEAAEKRKASMAAKKKAELDAKVQAAIAAKIAELSGASGSELSESD